MNLDSQPFADLLNASLARAGLTPLNSMDAALLKQFETYLSLILRWNARINLTSVRDEHGIITRHFVESFACARALPAGISTLLDFGSGAGFPGIPIALCRPEIAVTLAESQGKKAAFLQEAVRTLRISAKVHPQRAESLAAPFDCVVLRAVDRMPRAVAAAAQLVALGGFLALMSTGKEIDSLEEAAGERFAQFRRIPLIGGADRLLALGARGR
jgi:16S rRNA (guanine527-N7)-methyltransferase